MIANLAGLAFFLVAWLIVASAVGLLVCDLLARQGPAPDDMWDDEEDTNRWA